MIPVALEKFPSTFGLKDVDSKPFFPYLFNTTENINSPPLPLYHIFRRKLTTSTTP